MQKHNLNLRINLLQVRPTPAHLTSVQAEHILAQACENESLNAKRMRLGLDPVSQPMPTVPTPMVRSLIVFRLRVEPYLRSFSSCLNVTCVLRFNDFGDVYTLLYKSI